MFLSSIYIVLIFIIYINLVEIFLQVLDIYDPSLGLLRIGPFNYDPLRGVDLWLEQNDQFILTHLSTAPDVEPPNFVSKVFKK